MESTWIKTLLLLIGWFVLQSIGANLPTLTVSKLSTIRFPSDFEETTSRPRTTSLIITTETLTTTTPKIISPSKSNESSAVTILGNYSVAVQHQEVTTSNTTTPNPEAEEIIEKTSSLLELLDFWRQLPRSRLAEIYPHILGYGSSENVQTQTSTESVLQLLNKLRQQETSTQRKTSTVSSTTTSAVTSSSLILEESNEEFTTIRYEDLADAYDDANNNNDDTFKEYNVAETTSVDPDVIHHQDLDLIINNTQTQSIFTQSFQVVNGGVAIGTEKVSANLSDNLTESFVPSKISTTELIELSSSPVPPVSKYEFTDFPPPLPPPPSSIYNIEEQQNPIPAPPSSNLRPEENAGDDGYNTRHAAPASSRNDASFAVGVAVGILLCVIVAAACVTWCLCRKHWGRRNVYATMEAEEMPKAFTKPGPPIILPNELYAYHSTVVIKHKTNDEVQPHHQDITEVKSTEL